MTDTALAPPSGGRTTPRNHALPLLAALSLVVHVSAILLLLTYRREQATLPPVEIPVEVVQLPKEAPPREALTKEAPTERRAPKPAPAADRAKTEQRKSRADKQPPPRPAHNAPPKPVSPRPAPPPASLSPQKTAERFERLLGPMPAVALPGASDVGTEEVSYKELVLSQVAKAKKEGRYSGIPGVASVRFSLDDHGEIVRCEVVSKSVDPALDTEAMAMVRRGAPYPAPPPGAAREFVIGLRFAPLT